MLVRSATDIEEKELARFLFTSGNVPAAVLGSLDFDHEHLFSLEVPTRTLLEPGALPGDVDILARRGSDNADATAIEFKRVKVPSRAFLTGMPTKIRALRRGVHQANALYDLVFGRVLLLIAIVTDGRDQHSQNWLSKGPTAEHLKKIRSFPEKSKLYPHVGIAFIEIVQPTDKPIESAAGMGAYFDRLPVQRDQPQALNDAIGRHFQSTV